MGNTWRYVSEARGHLVEIYECLLDMPQQREVQTADELYDLRAEKVMNIVDVLSKHDVQAAMMDWREYAIDYLCKPPSVRSRQKFHDNDDRVLFLCVVLWYARVAVEWLTKLDAGGLLQGGIPYRAMTSKAAELGSRQISEDDLQKVLPEEARIVDEFDKNDPRLALYRTWTYISRDLDRFL